MAQARKLGLGGWVRNCADARVEAEFEGPKPQLEVMLDWCRTGPAFADVTGVEAAWEQGEAKYTTFIVRH